MWLCNDLEVLEAAWYCHWTITVKKMKFTPNSHAFPNKMQFLTKTASNICIMQFNVVLMWWTVDPAASTSSAVGYLSINWIILKISSSPSYIFCYDEVNPSHKRNCVTDALPASTITQLSRSAPYVPPEAGNSFPESRAPLGGTLGGTARPTSKEAAGGRRTSLIG